MPHLLKTIFQEAREEKREREREQQCCLLAIKAILFLYFVQKEREQQE
jgi:hypothetical protein